MRYQDGGQVKGKVGGRRAMALNGVGSLQLILRQVHREAINWGSMRSYVSRLYGTKNSPGVRQTRSREAVYVPERQVITR